MTEFDEQVAEALTPLLASFDAKSGHDHETGSSEAGWFGYSCVCEPDALARYIVPRVVAAIEAARHHATITKPGDGGPHFATAREAEDYAILRALRGDA